MAFFSTLVLFDVGSTDNSLGIMAVGRCGLLGGELQDSLRGDMEYKEVKTAGR